MSSLSGRQQLLKEERNSFYKVFLFLFNRSFIVRKLLMYMAEKVFPK